ncbi:ABC transporter permease, partial [Bacteroidota bacterium]
NIKLALRNIKKNILYSIINIGGLAIGLASFIFIILYINDELSYDKYHKNYDRIYRMNRLYNTNEINEDAATCSFPLAPALQLDYPNMVEKIVRLFDFQQSSMFFEYVVEGEVLNRFNEKKFFLADSSIFDVLTFEFVEGNIETALNRPNVIVISESSSVRYFGEESAIGKTLRFEEFGNFEITGVYKDIPTQSHFEIEILGSMQTFQQFNPNNQLPQSWVWNPCWTYLLLTEGVSPEDLEAQLPTFYENHYPDLADQDVTLYLQKITDIHLKSHHDYEMHANSNIIYVYILSIIAAIVLFLACINFMNLATASSTGRAKEIGVKKVVGGYRSYITRQFLAEAIVLSFISLMIAGSIVELLLKEFNNFSGKNISHSFIFEPQTLLFFVLLAFVVGLLAGTYPAFFLSSFNPIKVLKGSNKSGSRSGTARKILVILQFSISISLIIGTMIVFDQLKYLRNADLGFKKDQIIILPSSNRQIIVNYDAFSEQLLQHNDIKYVTGMEDVMGVNHNTRAMTIEGLDQDKQYFNPTFVVRFDFIETFDIEVVEGRAFSTDYPSDSTEAIMINETMVANLGWTNEEAIGKRVGHNGGPERVIGVFKDFNALSLRKPINNFVLDINPPMGQLTRYIAIRVNTNNYPAIMEYIEEKWNMFAPTRPIEITFLDDRLNAMYNEEDRFGAFSVMMTVLAIIIASLGLIGLTSFLAEQKTKEIGIRRALGASVGNILKILSFEFVKLILIANLIAWPITYIVAKNWLENFSKHTEINLFLFLYSGVIALVIAFLIIGYRAYKTSMINPADTLKHE